MNKKYLLISISIFLLISFLSIFLLSSESLTYTTMSSIFIPILFGVIINYDSKQKEIYKTYYEPLFRYIRTYYDILSQPFEKESMGKKHDMMKKISRDLIEFLNDNLKYASDEVCENFFYEYKNNKGANEFQYIYNMNRLIPILLKEIMENYNILHIDKFLLKKYYLNKKYHKVNGIVFMYIDSVLIDIARRKEYCLSLYDTVFYYQQFQNYRLKNHKNCYSLLKFINRNINDIDMLKRGLKNKFKINIKKRRDK